MLIGRRTISVSSLPAASRVAVARSFASMGYWKEATTGETSGEGGTKARGGGRPTMGVRNPFAYLRSADREPMLFSPEESLARLKERLPPDAKKGQFRAFFSSVVG